MLEKERFEIIREDSTRSTDRLDLARPLRDLIKNPSYAPDQIRGHYILLKRLSKLNTLAEFRIGWKFRKLALLLWMRVRPKAPQPLRLYQPVELELQHPKFPHMDPTKPNH